MIYEFYWTLANDIHYTFLNFGEYQSLYYPNIIIDDPPGKWTNKLLFLISQEYV